MADPTHDDNGKTRPGASSLTGTITPTSMADTDAKWADSTKNSRVRNAKSAQNPQVLDPNSPLEMLIMDAFERFGNMDIATMDGSIPRIMLRYANRIVEDIRLHPYTSTPDLDYYTSLSDARPIPDEIMVSGLTAYYAMWMGSAKAALFNQQYYQSLNQIMFQRKYGSGKIEINTVDKPIKR